MNQTIARVLVMAIPDNQTLHIPWHLLSKCQLSALATSDNFQNGFCDVKILDGQSGAVEDGDFIVIGSSRNPATQPIPDSSKGQVRRRVLKLSDRA